MLFTTCLLQVLVLIIFPACTVPPPLRQQRVLALGAFLISVIPIGWNVFVIVWGRTPFAWVVGGLNLMATYLLWLKTSIDLMVGAFF